MKKLFVAAVLMLSWAADCLSETITSPSSPGILSLATSCGATGGTIIPPSGTISIAELVNPQTGTNYAIQNSDCGKYVLLTNVANQIPTIATPGTGGNFLAGWPADVCNTGAGTQTITPQSPTTINGAATYVLNAGNTNIQCVKLISDGANYQIVPNGGGSITIGTTTIAPGGTTLTIGGLAVGSAGAPSLAINGLNGLWANGGTQLNLTANGAERLRVGASTVSALAGLVAGSLTQVVATAGGGANTPQLQSLTNSATAAANSGMISAFRAASATPGILYLSHSKSNTIGTQTTLASADQVGSLVFDGSDGTNFIDSSLIRGEVDNIVGANQVPGRIVFQTATSGGTLTEALRLTSTQQATFGGQINVTTMTQSSAAQSGTMCYNSGTGAITYDATLGCLSSSARFKDVIAAIAPKQALAEVAALTPVSFFYRPEYNTGREDAQVGFTAEQVATVDERLISRDAQGEPLGVRYQQLTAVLAGAIQELKAKNDELQACAESWKCRMFGWR